MAEWRKKSMLEYRITLYGVANKQDMEKEGKER